MRDFATYRTVRRLVWKAAFLFWFSNFLFASDPTTYLYLNSQPGDYIGGGIIQTLTPADGTFSVYSTANTVTVSFDGSSGVFWSLDFGSPLSKKFAVGQYVGAQRTAFRSPTLPGIDVNGDGRGCNTDQGQFLVSELKLGSDGTVSSFAVDFEQHCEGATPALYGSFRYNSNVSQVSRLGVGSSYSLKGNTATSDAIIPIALSIPSLSAVTAQYTTEDGSAKQGVDYVTTSGTVTFPAGKTSESVTVPVIGDRLARGDKSFKLKIQSPSGALIKAGSAADLIRDPNIPQSVLAMSSQPGDYVGGGLQYLITESDAVFTTTASANVVTISEQNGESWATDFAGPTTAQLTAGEYLNAQRYPFQASGTPGLSVYGNGAGCNTLTGNFDVLQAVYKTDNLQSFAANLEQHCEGATPALFGWVRIHSLLEQFSVTDAVIQGSSATFTVTVNPALANSVSVTFATADGTAVAGVDYVTTTQTLTFSSGVLEQTVTVPLLTQNSPKKTFYGQLSSPTGAAVWVSQSSADF